MKDLKLHQTTKGRYTNIENQDPRKYCPCRTRSFSGNKEQRHSCQQLKISWCCRQTRKSQFAQSPGQRKGQNTHGNMCTNICKTLWSRSYFTKDLSYCTVLLSNWLVFIPHSLETTFSFLCRDLTTADSFPVLVSWYCIFPPVEMFSDK